MRSAQPGLEHEYTLRARGLKRVAGLDEAGRGAWAGPVVAGAVILPLERSDLAAALAGVRDSKLCSSRQREALYPVVVETAVAAASGAASPEEIAEQGIVGATKLAMRRAIAALEVAPQALLIDSRTLRFPEIDLPQRSMDKGELQSLSIAAASIVAKVTRDHLMIAANDDYPEYGFARHKGYGTREHQQALSAHGPCAIHRRSFAPVARWWVEEEGEIHRQGAKDAKEDRG